MGLALYIAVDCLLVSLLVLRWFVEKWDREHPGTGLLRVIDAVTGRPLTGADVRIVHPSFVRADHKTNGDGFARVGCFGVTQRSVQMEISLDGYESQVLRPTLKEMTVALVRLDGADDQGAERVSVGSS